MNKPLNELQCSSGFCWIFYIESEKRPKKESHSNQWGFDRRRHDSINHQLEAGGGVQLVSYTKTAHNKAKAPHLRSRTCIYTTIYSVRHNKILLCIKNVVFVAFMPQSYAQQNLGVFLTFHASQCSLGQGTY